VDIQDIVFLLAGLLFTGVGAALIFDLNGLATKFRAVVLYRQPHRTLVPAGLTFCVFGLFLVVSAIVYPD
jgi:hypothetical protein